MTYMMSHVTELF